MVAKTAVVVIAETASAKAGSVSVVVADVETVPEGPTFAVVVEAAAPADLSQLDIFGRIRYLKYCHRCLEF